MEIINGKLHIDNLVLGLPEIDADSKVAVWRVPEGYRNNGIFFSVYCSSETVEIPACSAQFTNFLGEVDYPLDTAGQLSAAKLRRLAELNLRCNNEINEMTLGYPEHEVASWPQQVKEAEAYLSNPATLTPLLSSIGAARGIEIGDLAGRVIGKMDGYALATGAIIGRRQAAEDRLENALTIEDVESVTW